VIWRTEPIKASGNQKPDIAVRADLEIPDRKFKMTMSFRRNTDTSLPASHTGYRRDPRGDPAQGDEGQRAEDFGYIKPV
jgi:hypothetical protein